MTRMLTIIIAAAVVVAPIPSAESEARAAVADYARQPADAKPFIRYLTTYTTPTPEPSPEVGLWTDDRPDPSAVLAFWVNSLSAKSVIRRPAKVTETLWRLDLRDYGWTIDAWSKVTARDPYGRQVNSLIVRADWFVAETSDETRSPAYGELLYAGKAPKNVGEFRAFWRVDRKGAAEVSLERGQVVDAGDSIVALHNRIISRSRTIAGADYQSFDFQASNKARDALENLLNPKPDAQELITSMFNGLHAYQLANADGTRQKAAPTNIARDPAPPGGGDPAVRNPRSCVTCHGPVSGLHPPKNALPEILSLVGEAGKLGLYTLDKKTQQQIEAFYLTSTGREMFQDQGDYAIAVAACNGLTPEKNSEHFARFVVSYEGHVTREQAALELGATEEHLARATAASTKARVAALGLGRSMPRDSFEANYPEMQALLRAVK